MKKNLAQLAFNHFYGFRVPNLSSLVVTWDNCSPGCQMTRVYIYFRIRLLFTSSEWSPVWSCCCCRRPIMKNLQSKELRMKKSFFPPTLAKQATRCECALNQSTVERWCRGKFLFHKYRKLTLFVCVCTNMTNLWWPLLNFPRNQDIFFASSLHDDGQNLQTSPGARSSIS